MELVVLSGKGGTGKTTIATALADLAKDVVRIDCDVDAPNLYLFYGGENKELEDYYGGKRAVIEGALCKQCNLCESVCRFGAIHDAEIQPFFCEGCGACVLVCPQKAIQLREEKTAVTYISRLEQGILSRAEMEIGSDGSGKLISQLRKKGRIHNVHNDLVIIDGSPGVGCAVISSVTGADCALIVTEPTRSGLLDLVRVVQLCKHFKVLTLICINKFDINEEMTAQIESFAMEQQLKVVGRIPYDSTVRQSINELKPITEYQNSKARKAIEQMWVKVKNELK